jgi:DNA-binding CsgD family transcriptional regulator
MKRAIATLDELNALPVNAVILDDAGTIVAVNETWKEFARQNGLRLPNFGIGSSYLRFCGPDGPYPSLFATDLKDLLARRRKLLTLIYPCHSPTEKRWFSVIGVPLSTDKQGGVALLHINLTGTLAAPVGEHRRRATDRLWQLRALSNLDAVSGTIEHTVLETLSSQLNTMLADTPRDVARDDSAQHEAEEAITGHLSKRQMEVLRLIGQGKSNKEIAKALFRSPHTIKLHVSAILQNLNLKSRTQAALLASKIYKDGSAGALGSDAAAWKPSTAQRKPDQPVREKASA